MKRYMPLASIGAGLFLLLAGIGYLRFKAAERNPASVPLPRQIGDLPLTCKTTCQRVLNFYP